MPSRTIIPRRLLLPLLVLGGLACLFLLSRLSSAGSLGKNDFLGYWSATFLFRHGQNPYDLQSMLTLQHNLLKTGMEDPIMAWNPPTLFVFLLPLAWLTFDTARMVLLTINLIIISAATLMLSHLYLPNANGRFKLICLIFAFIFPPVISGIFAGQVTFFVFLGLVSCMVLIKRGQWFWAGAALILVTVKPQLVILSLIYLLTYMAQRRQFQGWLGLLLAGVFCILILFVFRPAWISDLIGEMTIAPVQWVTPTIGGLLKYLKITDLARFFILLFLPLPFLLLKHETSIRLETAVAILTLITVPATFFGWSFDQTILLIPIVQVFAWNELSKQRAGNIWLVIAVILSLIFNYLQRIRDSNEVFFVWVPLFWWLVFGLSWYVLRPAAPSGDLASE